MRVTCLNCKRTIDAPQKFYGRIVKCPSCAKPLQIPKVEVAVAPPRISTEKGPDPSERKEWHAVIDGVQSGPHSLSEMSSFIEFGVIGPETLIWKEGLADWMAVSVIPELSSAIAPPPHRPTPPPVPPLPSDEWQHSIARNATLYHAHEGQPPSKLTAVLLAVFLGLLGAQWFYLRNQQKAILYLLGGTIGWILIVPPFIVAVFCLIEAVTWLGWTDRKFEAHFSEQFNAE